MQYEQFKQMVESGQLTPRNQQDYQQYKSLWAEMIIKGDCVNILLTTQRVGILSGLLKHGHIKRPETWIEGTWPQQQALIHNDLYIDELLNDENPHIRLEIGYRHREFLSDLLKSGSVQNLMTRDLLNKVNPDHELVQILLNALLPAIPDTYGKMEVKALELKLQEPEQSMTAIECTMTAQQLYSVQSEHWYRTLTGRQTTNILYAECQLHDKKLVAAEFYHLYDSGDILSISPKVEKLKQERRIGLNDRLLKTAKTEHLLICRKTVALHEPVEPVTYAFGLNGASLLHEKGKR